MAESYVIKGLSRQAKTLGLPLPYFMAVGTVVVIPFMLIKNPFWFFTAPIWYIIARSISAINPNGHRIFMARMLHLPTFMFGKAVRFRRSSKGRLTQ